MQYSVGAYSSLDAPFEGKAVYSWWWRLIALASSCMILGGFLSLPPLFEDQPELRTGSATLIIVTAILLTGGFSLAGLVYYSCPSWQYRLDVIFLPGLSSSSLGLLTILYSFAISARYHWHAAAIAGTVLGILASLIYLGLSILAHRRITSPSSLMSTPANHRLRDLFPRRARNPQISISGEAPVEIITGEISSEEELTRQQMLSLLKQRETVERRQSEASLRSTYNIEMPHSPRHFAGDRLGTPQHVQDYYSPMNYPSSALGRRGGSPGDASNIEASQQTTLVRGSGGSGGLGILSGERMRSEEARQLDIERERAESRDIRRREIEMGQA